MHSTTSAYWVNREIGIGESNVNGSVICLNILELEFMKYCLFGK